MGRHRRPGEDDGFPRLHLPFDRLLTHTDAPAWTVTTAPEGPDVATVASMGIAATAGDPERVVRQLAELAGDGYRIVVAADGEGSAARLRSLLVQPRRCRPRSTSRPLERGCILPAIKLAVIAEHDLTGRRRAHRAARRPRRDAQGFFDDLKPGDHVVHHQHGVARYGGMVKRAIGGVERDYLLLEYKGDDKLYVPSDQIDAVRHYTGGDVADAQPARRRRLAAGQGQGALGRLRDRPGAGGALPDAPARARATPSPRTRRGSASSRTPSRTRRRPTSSPPSPR